MGDNDSSMGDDRQEFDANCSLLSNIISSKPIPNSLATTENLSDSLLCRRLANKTQIRSSPTCSLLDTLPKDVLVRDILGFLTDKGTKVFFEAVGNTRLQSNSFAEVRNQFCLLHGSKFEDSESFVISANDESITHNRKRSCPECFAEQQRTKRCHGCKIFYPHDDQSIANSKAFPGLKCQKCDRMAFCKACLSNEQPRRTSEPTILSGWHGRKHGLVDQRPRKSSCHNYCCSSSFTNTMCGEYVCSDCSDDNQKLLRLNESYENSGMEVCDDCGKSTCLDPHCLVCADFKLMHMVCKFSPEDAYKVDIGGLLFGSKRNGSNINKFRRNLSDCVVWIFVGLMLSKMWWFKKQHELQLAM